MQTVTTNLTKIRLPFHPELDLLNNSEIMPVTGNPENYQGLMKSGILEENLQLPIYSTSISLTTI